MAPVLDVVAGQGGVAVAAAKKPAKVTKVGLVPKTGSRNDSLRVRWKWSSGVKKYRVQVATNKKFTKNVKTLTVKAKGSRPAGGYQELTVYKLKNATKYRIRVQAVGGRKGAWSKVATGKTKVHIPERVTSLTAVGGSAPGTVVFRWTQKKTYTTSYVLELATSSFATGAKGLNHLKITIPGTKSSYTLTAAKAAKAGAPLGSGTYLYYRFRAVNKGSAGSRTRVFPNLRAVLPSPVAPATTGTTLHVASYNVASVKATAGSSAGGEWLSRVDKVAKTIVDSDAGVVGLQELGPGSAVDGGSLNGGTVASQAQSLVSAVHQRSGGSGFQLVRSTSYFAPGTKHDSQGARILYDSSRYRQLSSCAENTGNADWSASCTILLPLASGDSEAQRRRAAYALFEDLSTGARFWFVSAHLDSRNSTKASLQKKYATLRGKQAATVASTMASLNASLNLPIVVTGDFNDWQNDQAAGNPPHETFVAKGYYDASAAQTRVNTALPTTSQWRTTVEPAALGFGTRFDYILVHGARGAVRYVNTMVAKDANRASDHALVHAILRIPS